MRVKSTFVSPAHFKANPIACTYTLTPHLIVHADTHTDTQRDTQGQTHRLTERLTQKQTDTQTKTHRDTQGHRDRSSIGMNRHGTDLPRQHYHYHANPRCEGGPDRCPSDNFIPLHQNNKMFTTPPTI